MENLEEYIRDNRKDLDPYEPSPEIWEGIKRSLRTSKPAFIKWIAAAAVIVIILVTAIFRYKGESYRQSVFISDRIEKKIDNNPQLKESEIYYSNLMKNLYDEASPLLASYPDARKELLSDMSQIDSICFDIKKDLKDNIDNQEVIEALINNYRTKIHILEDMLVLLKHNENNHSKNDNHEL